MDLKAGPLEGTIVTLSARSKDVDCHLSSIPASLEYNPQALRHMCQGYTLTLPVAADEAAADEAAAADSIVAAVGKAVLEAAGRSSACCRCRCGVREWQLPAGSECKEHNKGRKLKQSTARV